MKTQNSVIYKWQYYNKINGSLYYCLEYAEYLNIPLYIIDCDEKDLIEKIVLDKYKTYDMSRLKYCNITNIYSLNLQKTLILDIKTFNSVKYFLTNNIYVFSNESHAMFRYKDSRTVTYFGSYDYQDFDKECYLKLNFDIFKDIESSDNQTFISSRNHDELDYKQLIEKYNIRKLYRKHNNDIIQNLFKIIDTIIYVHTKLDTNNRIIPEAFFYNKNVIIDDRVPEIVDSVTLRYNDLLKNGLKNYKITDDCLIIKEMQ